MPLVSVSFVLSATNLSRCDAALRVSFAMVTLAPESVGPKWRLGRGYGLSADFPYSR